MTAKEDTVLNHPERQETHTINIVIFSCPLEDTATRLCMEAEG